MRTLPAPTKYKELVGDFLGNGSFRQVYKHKDLKSRVIKVANTPKDCFHNWMEWWVWNTAPKHIKDCLAPVYGISPRGKYLEMHRVSISYTNRRDALPQDVQDHFKDLRTPNLGTLTQGFYTRLVICDYAMPSIPHWNPKEAKAPGRDWNTGDVIAAGYHGHS
jgi:hypothetical protein